MKHPEIIKEAKKIWNNSSDKTEKTLIDILISVGASDKHKEDIFDLLNDSGMPIDIGKDPQIFFCDFIIARRHYFEQQKVQEKKIKIDGQVNKLKKFIENYDDNKEQLSINDFKKPAKDLTEIIEQINSNVTPSKINFETLLIPITEESFINQIKSKPKALETSYQIEDDVLRFQTGALSIIAAPTGHGKTSFLLNLLIDSAKKYPKQRHWLFSYEEDRTAIILKTLNIFCNETYSKNNKRTIESYYRNQNTKDTNYFSSNLESFKNKASEFWELIERGIINIVHADYSIEDLIQAIKTVTEDNAGFIAIDYIQLLYKKNKNKYISRPEELKYICLDLKDLAIETKKPIIAAAQFNRTVINHEEMRPQRIADASDIEKAANKIIGLWNGDKKPIELSSKSTKVNQGEMYLKILKARDEKSDIEEIYEWNGNKGVICNTSINLNDRFIDDKNNNNFMNMFS